MSNSLFKDTVTLYHSIISKGSESIYRKVLRGTKYIETFKIEGDNNLVLYIPLGVKRSLKYVSPSQFKDNAHIENTFSISTGDKIVPGICEEPSPPENAYTVTVLEKNILGSLRMHHIKAKGTVIIPPVTEDEPVWDGEGEEDEL